MSRKRFERITNPLAIKVGDILQTIDHGGHESVELVDCIDNGKIFTVDYTGTACEEDLSTFVDDYARIYRIN